MTPLLPTKARPVRLQPAINPYQWLSNITLSPEAENPARTRRAFVATCRRRGDPMSWISYPAKSLAPQKPATTFSVGVVNNFGRKNYLYEPISAELRP